MAVPIFGGVNLKTLGFHNGVANAKAYGARADDSYDNLGILQAIVDAWEALDGGTILIPASQEGGRYRVTGAVVNDSTNVVSFSGTGGTSALYEAGGNQSVLWLDSDTDDAAIIEYASSGSTGGQLIERIHFMGNNDTDGLGANQSGVLFSGDSNNHLIRECGFEYLTGYAIAHDPTTIANYNQNSSIRNTHFWRVGGCFGPTEEYIAAANYLFNSLYTLDNVGLDASIGWTSWGHTPKPHIWDFRATRQVMALGNFLVEGSVATAGITSVIALAAGVEHVFGNIHYEITTNDPDYSFAIYGVSGGYFASSGEKRLKIGRIGVGVNTPIWFENDSTNESVVEIGRYVSYDANAVGDIVVWEDGVNVNPSGSVKINHLDVKTPFAIPESYLGRFDANMAGADHQSRVLVNQSARLLMSWNANKGSMLGAWGDVVIEDTEASIDSHAIEADGDFLCQRFTADSTYFVPRIKIRITGDNYEGSSFAIAARYRYTVDAADGALLPYLFPSGVYQTDSLGLSNTNLAYYSTGRMMGLLLDGSVDPNRWVQWRTFGGTATVPIVIRIIALEVWLGSPPTFALEPSLVPQVPTFGASDATPSVTGHKTWKTGTSGLTITDLDDFPAGEERTIISKGAIVFDTTSTNLVGSSVNITTATGDITKWVSEDGTTKRLIGFVDVSIDNSAGA